MENRKTECLNCQSHSCEEFLIAGDIFGNVHTYLKCLSCGLVYMWPLPSEEMLVQAYNTDYYGEGSEEKFSVSFIVKLIDSFAKKRAKRFAKHLTNGDRIMDVGCGNGRFLEHMYKMKRNFELNGIEMDARAALRASSRLKAKAWIHTVTDIDKFFGANSFNALSYIHVFEHLPNPTEVMNQLQRVIRSDGHVLIVIPNIESTQARKYKHNWLHLDPPRHLNFCPPQLLIDEMGKRGFVLVGRRYTDWEQNPFGAVQSMLNVITAKRDVLFERLKGNKNYAPKYKAFRVFLMELFWVTSMPFCMISDLIAATRNKSATVEMLFQKKME